MFDLSGGVLCPNIAAVEAAHFVALFAQSQTLLLISAACLICSFQTIQFDRKSQHSPAPRRRRFSQTIGAFAFMRKQELQSNFRGRASQYQAPLLSVLYFTRIHVVPTSFRWAQARECDRTYLRRRIVILKLGKSATYVYEISLGLGRYFGFEHVR